jgi:transcription antitermination factor NusG
MNPWYVLHVRPRCEKKVLEHCRQLRLSQFLPLRAETKVYQRRKVTVEKPVFPGYVFASFGRDGRVDLLKCNQIVRILEPGNRREMLHQLAQIRKALRADPGLVTCMAIQKGRQVRIRGGPFLGVEGRVSELKGTTKVILNVEMIGQAVVVEVERQYLEVLD